MPSWLPGDQSGLPRFGGTKPTDTPAEGGLKTLDALLGGGSNSGTPGIGISGLMDRARNAEPSGGGGGAWWSGPGFGLGGGDGIDTEPDQGEQSSISFFGLGGLAWLIGLVVVGGYLLVGRD